MSYDCSAERDGSGFSGCGRSFGSLRSFDRHFVKAGASDNPSRNRRDITIDGKRCALETELYGMGLVVDDAGVWKDRERGVFSVHGGPPAPRRRSVRAKGRGVQ